MTKTKQNPAARKLTTRLYIVLGFLIFGLAIAWIKSGTLQLLRGDELNYLSDKQHLRSISYSATRGKIYDRSGNLLSSTISLDSVFAEPNRIKNPKLTAAKIRKILPSVSEKTLKKLDSNQAFIWIARRIDPNDALILEKYNLPGIGFIKEDRRFYPNHALLGQTLGLVSIDQKAVSGIELAYDEILKPKTFSSLSFDDARGRAVRTFAGPSLKSLNGTDLYLTIDREIQYAAEEALLRVVQKYHATKAWAIVLNPATGEVLALANVPLLNPNQPNQDKETQRNTVISRVGEPGSTFKIVTFAAGFDAGVIDLKEKIYGEKGVWKLDHLTITDVSKREWFTPAEIFKLSSNIGTFKIAQRIGKKKLGETIKLFGFGELPGLNLMEETKGSISDYSSWKDARFANISFGYGIMANTLQLAMAAATIANDGIRVKPQLILLPKNEVGLNGVRVISSKAAKAVTDLMVQDVESGTGKNAAIKGISVAGKTGTAEKVDTKTGKYNKKMNVSSFVGFAPAEDPKIVVLVAIDEPQGASYGGVVAAPAFKEILTAALLKNGLLFHKTKNSHLTMAHEPKKQR